LGDGKGKKIPGSNSDVKYLRAHCSYCASRLLKYNKAGELIGQFGIGDSQIPHSLALAEDLDLICVADRENMR